MANLFTRIDKNGIIKYYGNLSINGKRIRRFLGLSQETAELALKKLEYDILFSKPVTENVNPKLNPATISFLTSLESSGVSTLHLKSIQGKIRAFLTYCESSSLFNIAYITPDIANQFIRNRTKQRVSNKYYSNFDGKYIKVQMNKTGDFLHVPIPEHVLDVLQPRMASSALFPLLKSDRQRRNCVKNIQRLFAPDFVRKNNINLHTLRHTYAHNMLNKGVPKEVLQTLLGHRSIKTTEIYANWVRKEELERWV
jgi:hypothetical protein